VTTTTITDEVRSVLVTVDDDPGVSRAVARDLRRRYGERHRIVRAESGDTALEALRQMKLRGDQVAVLLADYRMPGMTGIEFLERAMDVYPYAKRILLTAYADTSSPGTRPRRSSTRSSTTSCGPGRTRIASRCARRS
jgi:thioredoxin reductase (NADPH)